MNETVSLCVKISQLVACDKEREKIHASVIVSVTDMIDLLVVVVCLRFEIDCPELSCKNCRVVHGVIVMECNIHMGFKSCIVNRKGTCPICCYIKF